MKAAKPVVKKCPARTGDGETARWPDGTRRIARRTARPFGSTGRDKNHMTFGLIQDANLTRENGALHQLVESTWSFTALDDATSTKATRTKATRTKGTRTKATRTKLSELILKVAT